MRVLVVEDETKMASLLRRGLERAGYAVDVAMTGVDAIWYSTENEYDAIVLDVMIPSPDGFEVWGFAVACEAYFVNPLAFLPNLHDDRYLAPLRETEIVIATGRDDPNVEESTGWLVRQLQDARRSDH